MRSALTYIGAVVVGLLLGAILYNSGSSTSLAGVPTSFDCDGSTHTDDHVDDEGLPACGSWGVAILSDELEYPEGVEAADIERLEMEQALWGYLDRCTATAFVRDTGVEFERVSLLARLVSEHPEWEVADQLGQAPQHRHGEVSATAFLYSNPGEVWAECTMCGARLDLDDPRLGDRKSLRERRGVASD